MSGYPAPICLLHDSAIRDLGRFTDGTLKFSFAIRDLACFADEMVGFEVFIRDLERFADGNEFGAGVTSDERARKRGLPTAHR